VASSQVDQLCINTIRTLSMDAVQKAKSGHPGLPMGAASMAYVLWTQHLRHSPANPYWHNRDRFILSAGHGCMLLYCLLHLSGYDLKLDELKLFRQWGSRTPGHPERGLTPGVETSTGPLGQGCGNGTGMAIAEAMLAERFNLPSAKIVDHYTYGICSDGDLMEGVSHEVASFAGHFGLGKLIGFYDDNKITIDGSTDLSYSLTTRTRFRVNVFMQRKGEGAVFRTIPTKILTLEQLGMPKIMKELCEREKGLILVTGPTGSGKSTTLAAMIDYINGDFEGHILTIEDPIEFVQQL